MKVLPAWNASASNGPSESKKLSLLFCLWILFALSWDLFYSSFQVWSFYVMDKDEFCGNPLRLSQRVQTKGPKINPLESQQNIHNNL